MLKSVRFDKYDSFDDLGLVLTSSNIDAPSIKDNYVDIEGANGSVDFTEVFGDVFYENRKLSFDFTFAGDSDTFADKFSELQNMFHGQKMKIVISDDPEFYYFGRVELDKWKSSKAIRKITFSCECEPFKYQPTIRVYNITTNPQVITFKNLRMRMKPTLLCDKAVTVECNGKTVTLSAGVSNTGTIRFEKDLNSLTIRGNTDCELCISCLRGSL